MLFIYLTGGPTSFSISKADIARISSGNLLDVLLGLRYVIEVGSRSTVDVYILPVGESIGQTKSSWLTETHYTSMNGRSGLTGK